MNNSLENKLWVEKYRPKTLSDYVGNEEFKSKIQHMLDEGEIPHLLLYGNKPGTGKCLDFSEEISIEIELTDIELKLLAKYII